MSPLQSDALSRRERQIMDAIYRLGAATAGEVLGAIADPPSDASVRKLIRILEQKGHLTHRSRGSEYVYSPTVAKPHARKRAMRHLVDTFFEGSAPKALTALLDASADRLTQADLDALTEAIRQAAKEGR